MFNIWVKISFVAMLLGIGILIRAYIGFCNSEKAMDKTKGFSKENIMEYMNSYMERNYYYGVVGSRLVFASTIAVLVFL
jgi:hypothetical protein